MLAPALLHHALEVTTVDRLLFSTDHAFQQPTPADLARFLSEFAGGTVPGGRAEGGSGASSE